ncbi:hypothetical protein RRG08_038577 [Elysia crispata]|uniref:Uncharacterized protein n=1 Tax=Elysia crispata TaxID=231223 RepID=A0AAE0YG94_9GAST|nr:hypothetical protein RRG08_038577 [Elysia crispata]
MVRFKLTGPQPVVAPGHGGRESVFKVDSGEMSRDGAAMEGKKNCSTAVWGRMECCGNRQDRHPPLCRHQSITGPSWPWGGLTAILLDRWKEASKPVNWRRLPITRVLCPADITDWPNPVRPAPPEKGDRLQSVASARAHKASDM